MKVYIATVEGKHGGFSCLGAFTSEKQALDCANAEKKRKEWIASASCQVVSLHDADMDMYRRQLGGMTASKNRFKHRCEELEWRLEEARMLVGDLYNAIPEEDTGRFAHRVAEVYR